jgi:hypothetical protein
MVERETKICSVHIRVVAIIDEIPEKMIYGNVEAGGTPTSIFHYLKVIFYVIVHPHLNPPLYES